MLLHILIYSAAMILVCVIFGKFWVEMSGMGAKQVAGQLQTVGLHVPGFRRDPRVIEMVLERYIPMITILGSAAVGSLAVLADLTGALGTGTGILLTVGILYRMYEELAAQQAFEMMPALKAIFGG
jgi:preprotein translocase subunit SecY